MSNPRSKGWSNTQRRCFVIAANQAGWNEQQRYMAMRHVGCRDLGDLGRPSVSHPKNTNAHFEQVMAIAEAHAILNGGEVRPPRDKDSWRQAASKGRDRQIDLARAIAAEARDRLPAIFKADPLPKAVHHVTQHDNEEFGGRGFDRIEDCDGGQIYRAVECLRAWVGRYFAEAGLTPRSFNQPAEVYRRVATQVAKTRGSTRGCNSCESTGAEQGLGPCREGGGAAPAVSAPDQGRRVATDGARSNPAGAAPSRLLQGAANASG